MSFLQNVKAICYLTGTHDNLYKKFSVVMRH